MRPRFPEAQRKSKGRRAFAPSLLTAGLGFFNGEKNMGYFPNGTSGRAYQERYCENCVHDVDRDCAVWLAHLVSRGDEKQEVLDLLIPETDDGIGCKQCKMFMAMPNE